jgi:hypothetical protein
MSIAHSVLLLVTLFFILTTRGIRLPNGLPPLQQDFTFPDQSLHLHRSSSAFLPVDKTPTPETFVKLGFPSSSLGRQSVKSAPPTLARRWNTSTPSNLHRFFAVEATASDTEEEEEMGDGSGMEEELLLPGVGGSSKDYPTPTPDMYE